MIIFLLTIEGEEESSEEKRREYKKMGTDRCYGWEGEDSSHSKEKRYRNEEMERKRDDVAERESIAPKQFLREVKYFMKLIPLYFFNVEFLFQIQRQKRKIQRQSKLQNLNFHAKIRHWFRFFCSARKKKNVRNQKTHQIIWMAKKWKYRKGKHSYI